jgi:hypothetical protein
MRRNQQCALWLGISILGVLNLSPVLLGQASVDAETAAPVVSDWTNHHVIFSRPATAEQAKRVERDPRYWQQISRRSPPALAGVESADGLPSQLRFGSDASLSSENQNLKGDWSEDMGAAATVGAANYPAKFTLYTTVANCGGAAQPDFVVYSTGLKGTSGQAEIVAYDNIYSGCGGTVPSVYWAYYSGATISTSPVFSRDGTQLAWVNTNASGIGVLVVAKWAASATDTISHPSGLPFVNPTAYLTCTAPCRTAKWLQHAGIQNSDTNSSVFYDYADDVAYVGDDAGYLHKFTPVFKGILTEVFGAWPVLVNPTAPTPLTSPVYDPVSGNVFVEDIGGFLYSVASTSGLVTQSGQLDFSVEFDGGPGFVQGPIVDPTGGLVYAFATSDGSEGCVGGADCTAVYALSTSFAANDTGSEAVVGASSVEPTVPSALYIGAFDSTYINSVNASGHLYVCGNTGGPPVLYQIPIQGGVLGAPLPGPVLSTSASTPCSPVTDVLNPNASGGPTEWMFASVENGGISTGCASGGCIFNFKDTPWLPKTVYTAGQEILDSSLHVEVVELGGTSGATVPFFNGTTGGTTLNDGTVTWLDQGAPSATTLPGWTSIHHYAKGTEILDGSGNIELVTSRAGISGTTLPTFSGAPGGTVTDGTGSSKITWTNIGSLATAAMPEAGGTSGIIIDNTVGAGTLAGASQIYFSTLNGGCGAGTDGCAVQASQSALH